MRLYEKNKIKLNKNNMFDEEKYFEERLKNKNKEKYNLVVSFMVFSFMLWNNMEEEQIENWIEKIKNEDTMFTEEFYDRYNFEADYDLEELFLLKNFWFENFEKFIAIIQKEPFNCDKKYLNYDKKIFSNWKSFSENATDILLQVYFKIRENEKLSYVY